jgi:predicted negative regulator of RcsB-dependent stress response
MTFLLSALTFFKDNLKWVAILAALSVLSVVGYKTYHIIQDNAIQAAQIESLKNEAKIKDLSIDLLKQSIKITQDVIKKRDDDLAAITDKLDEIKPEEDKTPGAQDLAHESIRTNLKKLKDISGD